MMIAMTEQLSSSRLGLPHFRAAGASGYRLPQRLIDGSRLMDMDLRMGLVVLRGSRIEASAPERL